MLPRKPAFYYMRYARKKYVYQRRIETAVTECGTYGKRDDPDPFFHPGIQHDIRTALHFSDGLHGRMDQDRIFSRKSHIP